MGKKKRKKKNFFQRKLLEIKERLAWPDISSMLVFSLTIMIVIGVWMTGAWYLIEYYYKKNSESAAQFGDTLGALNSFFSGLAFAGLVYTILLQRKELRETREEFKQQNITLRFQRFENTLFNLLSSHSTLLTALKGNYINYKKNPIVFEGRDLFYVANQELRERVKLMDISSYQKIDEDLLATFRKLYVMSVDPIENHLGLYLSSLVSILKFISQSDLFNYDFEKEFYFSIVRSQLSIDERRFLYYFMSIADPSRTSARYIWALRSIEKEYMFNEFSIEFLFHESHIKLQASWDGFMNYEDEDPDYEEYLSY